MSIKVIQNYVDLHFAYPGFTFAKEYGFAFFKHNEERSLHLTRLLWVHTNTVKTLVYL